MNPFRRLRALFRKGKLDAEMGEEMRHHVELQTELNRKAGMNPDEARYAALRQFGNVASLQERAREGRGWVSLEQLGKDFRFAARSLGKAPGYTLAVVATLAIGIGATTAMISVARQALFPVLPFADENSVVVVEDFNTQTNTPFILFDQRFDAFRAHTKSFAHFAAMRSEGMNLLLGIQPVALQAVWVTPDFFTVFGVNAVLGRTFGSEAHLPDTAETAVVLTYRTWLRDFAGDPAVIGRDIVLGGMPRRVIGVMPATFRSWPGSIPADVYLSQIGDAVSPAISVASPIPSRLVWAAGRLKPGVTVAQAQAELATTRMPNGKWSTLWAQLTPRVIPIRDKYRADASYLFWVFLGAVGCVYAIACANAMNLALVRALMRRRELAMRLALGGSRRQLVQLLLVESLLLTGVAGVAGLVLARMGCLVLGRLIAAWLPSGESRLIIDHTTLVATIATCLVTGLLLALIPAWRVGRADLQTVLKEGYGALGDSVRLRRLRDGFVVLQAALATALLIGGGLMMRSYARLEKLGVGFDTARLYMVLGNLPSGLPRESYFALSDRLVTGLGLLPGVKAAVQADVAPMSSTFSSGSVRIDGRPELGDIQCSFNSVSPGYFATLGLPLRAGRGFAGMHPGDPRVMVINETMARKFFPAVDPLGQRLDLGQNEKGEIIGVVADVREQGARNQIMPQVYVPVWQRDSYNTYYVNVLVRLAAEPGPGFEAGVRREAYAADPRLVVNLSRLEDGADFTVRIERCTVTVLQVLASLALFLAALGLFAVMANAVAQRQREFGVRLALGATQRDVLRLVLQRGLVLAAIGVAVGLGAAWGLTRLLQSVLFETAPHDPLTFAAVAVGLLMVAAIACWLPARRAAKVDPVVALRSE